MSGAERRQMREGVREVDFPTALRGYDRAAVDRYVEEVNRLIAELEISSSPESAIRRALEEVSEETSALLQRASEAGDEITARSRARADDRLQQAEREANEMREAAAREARELRESTRLETQQLRATAQHEVAEMREGAEARVRELDASAAAIWEERRRLVDDMSEVGQRQLEAAKAAEARFPRPGTHAEGSAASGDSEIEEQPGTTSEPEFDD